jgi:predicted aspartyl protease
LGNSITIQLPDEKRQSVIIDIEIGASVPLNSYPKGKKINIKSKALIDTGATASCISRRFAQKAGLNSFKMSVVHGVHGFAVVPVYKVDFVLPIGILITNLKVTEFNIQKKDVEFDFIIGMNILQMGDMALTNAKGKTVFSFRIPPADTHIDFTQD